MGWIVAVLGVFVWWSFLYGFVALERRGREGFILCGMKGLDWIGSSQVKVVGFFSGSDSMGM